LFSSRHCTHMMLAGVCCCPVGSGVGGVFLVGRRPLSSAPHRPLSSQACPTALANGCDCGVHIKLPAGGCRWPPSTALTSCHPPTMWCVGSSPMRIWSRCWAPPQMGLCGGSMIWCEALPRAPGGLVYSAVVCLASQRGPAPPVVPKTKQCGRPLCKALSKSICMCLCMHVCPAGDCHWPAATPFSTALSRPCNLTTSVQMLTSLCISPAS
jgi:hypothetical protein